MTELTIEELKGDSRRVAREWLMHRLFALAGISAVLFSGLIVYSLFSEAWVFMREVEWGRLWTDGWFPRRNQFDIKTLVVGSVIVTVVGLFLAGPVGLASAVYLSEYASRRVRNVVKPVIEVLAGIPSVVIGFFALVVIGPYVVQKLFSSAPLHTMLSAGIGVGIMLIPVITSISEDALSAVPQSLREASYGMGARKVTTVVRVVIPAAISGLVAAFIVAFSMGIGETMVVYLAAGKSGGALFQVNPLEGGLTMTAAMASVASGTDQVAGQGPSFQSLFFVGLLLFLITLTLNLVAERYVRRVRQAVEF